MMRRPEHTLLAAALIAVLTAGACQGATPSTASTPVATPTAEITPTPTPFAIPSLGPDGTVPPASQAPRLDHIAITLEPFATVSGGPLAVTAPDDGTGRLFVAAQNGKIWVVEKDGAVLPDPIVDLGSRLRSGGEQGLLGIATHPTFPTDPRIFVNYTNKDGDTIVASLALDPDSPDRLDPDSHRQLLFVDQPFPNHNGGGVLFGPDGYLYLSLGDGGSGGDPQGNGQSLETLLGKILRIDVDADPAKGPYVVPPDNPFANGGGLPEIWHWGLRNPWRLSFDRATGDLWIGDVGQGAWEEVDVARQGTGGLNFGWNQMEGSHCYSSQCEPDKLTPPVSDYGRNVGCTVIGGSVYRGSRHPFLVGTYVFADYCTGRIFALDAASNGLVAPVVVGSGAGGQISAFGEDADGELYVTNLGGEVSRVVATER